MVASAYPTVCQKMWHKMLIFEMVTANYCHFIKHNDINPFDIQNRLHGEVGYGGGIVQDTERDTNFNLHNITTLSINDKALGLLSIKIGSHLIF